MHQLDKAINKLLESHAYAGLLLQQIKVKATKAIPTLGVMLNKLNKFEMIINYDFLNKLSLLEQVAVLHHEMLHLIHKHVVYAPRYKQEDRRLLNIAMDMVINQLIKNLPNGCADCPPPKTEGQCPNEACPGKCIMVENFTHADGKPFPHNQTFEFYYRELKKLKDQQKSQQEQDADGDNKSGKLDKNGQPKKSGNGEVRDKNGQLVEDSMDSHDWEYNEEALKELKGLLRRTLDKHTMEYGVGVKSIEEAIDALDVELKDMDYKRLIDMAYKKSMPSRKRLSTWKRPSRRYGYEAKGNRADESPRVDTYVDTSGSISITEFNEFLKTNDQFIKYANNQCQLNYFHDIVYRTDKYKIGTVIDKSNIQSGGTCLQGVLQKIKDDKPDLAIILTDGCYGDVKIDRMPCPVLFIISKGGSVNHPLQRYGTTVQMK